MSPSTAPEKEIPADDATRLLLQSSALGVCVVALASPLAIGQTQQEHLHQMGQTVMPFALDKTTHLFRMTDTGGIQSVVVKDAQGKERIALIRQHLRHEAEAFQEPSRIRSIKSFGPRALAKT